ncbi:uncharacterized protein LOC132042429 [Lycium ferocissimum]|uniref:uncharacterized protein LOC132042429 n=1 Tax=Lycium ferocissimum TaxID=112874 RepID=UPI002814A303|nr:uncharacterized protein LOC132042429 [Lycium ferocissimum]
MIKQVYHQLLGDSPKVPWRYLLFQNLARPKAQFIMWLQIQNRLLTTDRLLKWNIQVDPVCQMCHNGVETRDHLFFYCCFAQQLWHRLRPVLQNWNLQCQTILSVCKGKTIQAQLNGMLSAEFIFALRIERNNSIFEKTEKQQESIAKEIACVCNIRASALVKSRLHMCKF